MKKVFYKAGEKVVLFMNLYQAGWFHRKGKPGTIDVHPGDFYVSREKAVSEIDRAELYMGTVSFEYEVPEGHELMVNPEDSKAIPLSVSRRQHLKAMKAKGIDILQEFATAEAATAIAKAASAEPALV